MGSFSGSTRDHRCVPRPFKVSPHSFRAHDSLCPRPQRLRAIEIYDFSWIQTRYGQASSPFGEVDPVTFSRLSGGRQGGTPWPTRFLPRSHLCEQAVLGGPSHAASLIRVCQIFGARIWAPCLTPRRRVQGPARAHQHFPRPISARQAPRIRGLTPGRSRYTPSSTQASSSSSRFPCALLLEPLTRPASLPTRCCCQTHIIDTDAALRAPRPLSAAALASPVAVRVAPRAQLAPARAPRRSVASPVPPFSPTPTPAPAAPRASGLWRLPLMMRLWRRPPPVGKPGSTPAVARLVIAPADASKAAPADPMGSAGVAPDPFARGRPSAADGGPPADEARTPPHPPSPCCSPQLPSSAVPGGWQTPWLRSPTHLHTLRRR